MNSTQEIEAARFEAGEIEDVKTAAMSLLKGGYVEGCLQTTRNCRERNGIDQQVFLCEEFSQYCVSSRLHEQSESRIGLKLLSIVFVSHVGGNTMEMMEVVSQILKFTTKCPFCGNGLSGTNETIGHVMHNHFKPKPILHFNPTILHTLTLRPYVCIKPCESKFTTAYDFVRHLEDHQQREDHSKLETIQVFLDYFRQQQN